MKYFLAILLFSSTLFSQIHIWQGFSIDWTYNHRLNRLGSYIYQDTIFQSAATGIGKDSGNISTSYLKLDSDDYHFHEIKFLLKISGKEKEVITVSIDTILDFDSKKTIVFLNGFELTSLEDADKLQQIHFNITQDSVGFEKTKLVVNATTTFNCQSLECNWFQNTVNYELKVIVGFLESYHPISKTKIESKHSENWTKSKQEILECQSYSNSYPIFINEFSIQLDKAQWFAAISCFINNSNEVCMQVKQYKPNMKKNAYYKPHANFSAKHHGKGFYTFTGIYAKEIAKELTTFHQYNSTIIWMGNNQSAISNNAIKKINIHD